MKSIGNILGDHRSETPVLRQATAALVVDTASEIIREIFGDQIQAYAQVIYVKNKTLAIKCMSPAAAQEIRLNENDILAKISQKLGYKPISKINCIV